MLSVGWLCHSPDAKRTSSAEGSRKAQALSVLLQ